jgi:hypothetical protein
MAACASSQKVFLMKDLFEFAHRAEVNSFHLGVRVIFINFNVGWRLNLSMRFEMLHVA